MSKINPKKVNRILLISSILFSLLFCEVFLRIYMPKRAPFEAQFPAGKVRKPYPYIMFKGTPNALVSNESTERFNENGYRGAAPKNEKNKEYRIFILGGSTVFLGDPPIPEVLENIFHKNGYKNVCVYNYGVVGSTSGNALARMVFEISDFSPDIVIMYNGGNDIQLPLAFDPRPGYPFNYLTFERNPVMDRNVNSYPWFHVTAYGSSICRYFFPKSFVKKFSGIEDLRNKSGFQTRPWKEKIAKEYINNLVKANKIAKGLDTKFFTFFQPLPCFKPSLTDSEKELSDTASFDFCREIHKKIFALHDSVNSDKSLHLIDLSDIYTNDKEQMFIDCIHTTQEGKVKVATAIYDSILKCCKEDILESQFQ